MYGGDRVIEWPYPDDRVLLEATRDDHRVAELRTGAGLVGYLRARMDSLQVRDRKGSSSQPFLAWDYEFTSEFFRANGYGDAYGAAYNPVQIQEVVDSWNLGRHEDLGESFDVAWLAGERARSVAELYWGRGSTSCSP